MSHRALLALALAMPLSAWAQDTKGFDAHGFAPTALDGDPRDPLTVERPGSISGGDAWLGAAFEYASNPLTVQLQYPEGSPIPPSETFDALSNVVAMNLSAGYAPARSLRFHVSAPIYMASTFVNANDFAMETPPSQNGAGLGDVRISGMIGIARPDATGFGMGLVPFVELPTGTASHFLGKPGAAGGLLLATTFELNALTITANLGAGVDSGDAIGNWSSGVRAMGGLAFGYLLSDNIGVNAEAHLTPAVSAPVDGSISPAEGLIGLRGRTEGGLHWGLAGGGALSHGTGASDLRLLLTLGYGHLSGAKGDRDTDGISDELDKCPKEAEVINTYKDDDGCPDAGGTLSITALLRGQIQEYVDVTVDGADTDGNPFSVTAQTTLPDPIAVPVPSGDYRITAKIPGFTADQPFTMGEGKTSVEVQLIAQTPAHVTFRATDSAGGSIARAGLSVIQDGTAFQSEALDDSGTVVFDLPPGKYVFYVKAKGVGEWRRLITVLPGQELDLLAEIGAARTQIVDDHIQLLDKVYFPTDSDEIEQRSFSLLEEAAALLATRPDILQVEVQGHTDSEGTDADNLDLSQRRAAAVMRYLTAQGITPDRLTAVGYGETKPVGSNDTPEGRAMNRRVELFITRRVE